MVAELNSGIIHAWARRSNNPGVLRAGFLYNRLKNVVGLGRGVGSLIDPGIGRDQFYQAKIIDLAAYRLQKRLEGGKMAYFLKEGEMPPELEKLSVDQLKTLLGGKGYGLYKMMKLGLPVPVTVTLPAWMCFRLEKGKLIKAQKAVILENLALVEQATGKKFGDVDNPLFVSCRSGAKKSMPGMMETVLNLGMNKELVFKLIEKDLIEKNKSETAEKVRKNPELEGFIAGHKDQFRYDGTAEALILKGIMSEENQKELLAIYPGSEDKKAINRLFQRSQSKARFWLDSYCTFLAQFGNVVFNISESLTEKGREVKDLFEEAKAKLKSDKYYKDDTELKPEDLRGLISIYDGFYKRAGKVLPTDYREQCFLAAETVFASWDIPRAKFARKEMGIPDNLGTAVNFVEMVFGNKGPLSATGVLFTRDNTTGENKVSGNVLFEAQGEQVVAGVRDTLPLEALRDHTDHRLNKIYDQIMENVKHLEEDGRDMQDVEFTIEQNKVGDPVLFILQTRDGKRSGEAAIKIAMDLFREGKISAEEAVMRVEPDKFREVLFPKFDPAELDKARAAGRFLGKGTPGTLGAGTGEIIFDPKELARLVKDQAGKPKQEQKHYILVRPLTMQDDVPGMKAADAVLTQTGSKVCHAVIMTTMWGVPCVVAFKGMEFVAGDDGKITGITIKGKTHQAGAQFSVNGTTGEIFAGAIKTIKPKELGQDAQELLGLADTFKRLTVRANTELETAELTKLFGAKGSGLVRTEHMFTQEARLHNVRLMFLKYLELNNLTGKTEADRSHKSIINEELTKILAGIGKSQEEDFYQIYRTFNGEGVTSRLLDAPLHEFLPREEEDLRRVETDLQIDRTTLKQRLKKFQEENPMLGFRSVRMGIVFPEIYKTQVRAMLQAAGRLLDEGKDPRVEIEIPLVSEIKEIEIVKKMVEEVAAEVTQERGGKAVPYKLGIMVETPSAALQGVAVAEVLGPKGFVSFGTNDLTQLTKGLSRDDAEFFLQLYAELNTYDYGKKHPFLSLDPMVVRLMKIFIDEARSVLPEFEVGICGEHGGDPYSIGILHRLGLNVISMSAYSVPPARLAAAQAAIEEQAEQLKRPVFDVLLAGTRWGIS